MENNEHHYGLMTAITMIVGICIGSGIFFKADDILRYTGGDVALGVVVLCLGAFSIIFGSLSLTELSVRTEKNGGLVGYFEDFISPEIASAFGWFQTFLYIPSINVVVSWAAGIYTLMMLGVTSTLERQILVGAVYLLLIYGMNYLSLRLGGNFQIITTYVKLIPLAGVALLGMFWQPDVALETSGQVATTNSSGWLWLAALAPTAFSYDGWPVATSITNEIKNPKRNMPLALIIGPTVVLTVYVLYFLGINRILGAEYILQVGDQAIYDVGRLLLGERGGAIILSFVVVSVLGVTNGLTIGNLRMPQALATKNMIPFAKEVGEVDMKKKLSKNSFYISLFFSIFWMLIHYLTQKMNLIPGGDISEIAIIFGYICYPVLYVKIIQMYWKKEVKSVFKGLLSPVLGVLGSLIIVLGGIISNPVSVSIFIGICFIVSLTGFIYYRKKTFGKRSFRD
ncbi:APC family permease [Vagococcus elongatus]|uniref:Amino acid permease n=1 Tax=Vagococcus elongatus TaxID=180344 RepID=A0A430AP33_9ENTE|nr:APC family permease [Vagococcus elongatus]RSU09816.1 hypothetical protein CBF29_10620 [Vagococcus elongatus]